MINEIKRFLDNDKTTGALMINGDWGSGKTYFVKNILSKSDEINKRYAFLTVSLFGIGNLEEINKKIKTLYSLMNAEKRGGFKKGTDRVTGIFRRGKEQIQNTSKSFADLLAEFSFEEYGAAIKFLSGVVTLYWHFLPISNKIVIKNKRKENTWNVVLVFDDLERFLVDKVNNSSHEKLHEVLGFINEFSENQNFKVIVLANENEIPLEQYNRIKEKVIAQTLKYKCDICSVFDEIIKSYKDGYKEFLIEQKGLILDSFEKLGKENIRSLINGLALFKGVFHMLSDMYFDPIKNILISFLNTYYLISQGTEVTQVYNDLLSYEYAIYNKTNKKNEDIKDTIAQRVCSDNFFIYALADWIERGTLNKQAFDEELKKIIEKQKPKELRSISDAEKILTGWTLTEIHDKDLMNAFVEAVKAGYEGKTNFAGYTNIIIADATLNSWEIKHESINWDRLEDGLTTYINELEAGEELKNPEDLLFRLITEENLKSNYGKDAERIYKKIRACLKTDINSSISTKS